MGMSRRRRIASSNRRGSVRGCSFTISTVKKELFNYLIEYAIDTTMDEFFSRIDANERDFIERMRQIAQVKTTYYYENPHVSNFIATVYLSDDVDLPVNLQARLDDLQKRGYTKMYDNIDKTLFRDDVDAQKAFNLIRWAIEGYQNELMEKFKGKKIASIDLEPYWEEFYEYLKVLKTIFYKEGDGE